MYISSPSRQINIKLSAAQHATQQPATGQTFSQTVPKKVKPSASHAMLPKPMQS